MIDFIVTFFIVESQRIDLHAQRGYNGRRIKAWTASIG